ncbi:DUF551 domain-containing protein [Escherichia coli]|nr:DUF551 domain-containing protein [Escherichia coli]EES4951878.1 DUF551 domain-containing protein [Escherichia coli]EES6429375.1 DUF551 domain-containing protein [Escherichia coli]MCQ0455673.1 DUF551 domain-containing protein [Escherichia coli]
MITITKGRLLTIKQWRETYGPGSNVVLPAEEAEELARIALVSLEAEPVAKIIAHYPLGVDVGKQKFVQAIGELPDFGGYLFAAPPAPIVPEEMYWQDAPVEGSSKAAAYATGWNDCREAMLQSGNFRENKDSSTNNFRKIPEASTSSPVTPALLPGGFTIEEAKELHEDLARSHISKALSGEKMKKKDRDADLRWIHGVIVQAAWFVKASLEQNALSGNYPVTPDSWISCSERMPDKLIPVMVMYEDGEMWSAMWNGNRWDDGTEYPDPHSVTHWREMPAAPQQEVNQ